jgi:pyruvate kinase
LVAKIRTAAWVVTLCLTADPPLYCPSFQAESTSATNESVLKVALDHGKASGVIKSHDRVVVCQKVGDSSVVKIIELDD